MHPDLRVDLLGAFAVTIDGRPIPDRSWRLRRARSLVKLLALEPERRLHADRAIDLLWPAEAANRNNLYQAIYAARRALDAGGVDGRRLLELHDDLIFLGREEPVGVDVETFETAAARARTGGDADAYRTALAAYAGELLPEDRYEDWTTSRREALRETRLALGIELAEIVAGAEPEGAILQLREVLVAAPLHEPAHRALMRLYAEAGRRQEALAQFQELKGALEREFADEPDDETRALYRDILRRSLGGPTAVTPTLPRRLSSFVGRERELAETMALLDTTRLLTLTGSGGSGKTRLAYEVARRRAEAPDVEVRSVELEAIGDSALVTAAVAQSLGTSVVSGRGPEIALAAQIGERPLLLVLDNCEHLISRVATLVGALLDRCPRLVVLATSRERLRVPGEVTWRVPPLSLPELVDGASTAADVAAARRAESVCLFVTRAAQVSPGFALAADNVAAISLLCHRLDGVPLAIELAAAQVPSLTPAQMVARLDDPLELLSGGSRTAMTRQQTLRATLAWSFDLLEPDEQVLLRRLSVFAGGFGVDAVEGILAEPGGEAAAYACLGRLVDKSLVQVDGEMESRRFRLLDTVRVFAAERLAAAERAELSRRHRDWYTALAMSDPTPAGDLPAAEWLATLDRERDNLRAVLAGALADDPQAGLRLVVSLWGFWLMRGHLAEAARWLEDLLNAAPEQTAVRAEALLAACMVNVRRGSYERIGEFLSESAAIRRELGDHAGELDAIETWTAYLAATGTEDEVEAFVDRHAVTGGADLPAARPAAWAAQARGLAALMRGDCARSQHELETVLARLEEMEGDRRPALWPIGHTMLSAEPEFGYPFRLQEDTLMVGRRVGVEAASAYTLVNLAGPLWAEGDPRRARESAADGLARFRALGDRQGESFALNSLGNLARRDGRFEEGREALAEALALREAIADGRGAGISLACTGLLLARAGDPTAGRSDAARARRWFAANDDLIGTSAAELVLAAVALCENDTATARTHLEGALAGISELGGSYPEGWLLLTLAMLGAEGEEPLAAERWLRRARRCFDLLGAPLGRERCDLISPRKTLQRSV